MQKATPPFVSQWSPTCVLEKALSCLTSLIGREAVYPGWYERFWKREPQTLQYILLAFLETHRTRRRQCCVQCSTGLMYTCSGSAMQQLYIYIYICTLNRNVVQGIQHAVYLCWRAERNHQQQHERSGVHVCACANPRAVV